MTKFPNLVNASGEKIAVSVPAMEKFLDEEGIDRERFRVVPVHFTPQTLRRGDDYTFGVFNTRALDDRDPTRRWRTVRVHVGSVGVATDSQIDLATGHYHPSANSQRNLSAVLMHELMHLKDDFDATDTIESANKRIYGLVGRFGLSHIFNPGVLKAEMLYQRGVSTNEFGIRLRINEIFDQSDDFDRLVSIII